MFFWRKASLRLGYINSHSWSSIKSEFVNKVYQTYKEKGIFIINKSLIKQKNLTSQGFHMLDFLTLNTIELCMDVVHTESKNAVLKQ